MTNYIPKQIRKLFGQYEAYVALTRTSIGMRRQKIGFGDRVFTHRRNWHKRTHKKEIAFKNPLEHDGRHPLFLVYRSLNCCWYFSGMWADLLDSTRVAATTNVSFLHSRIGEVIILVQIWWEWICQRSQRSIIISLLLNSIVESLCRYRFVIPSLDWRVCAHWIYYITFTRQRWLQWALYMCWCYGRLHWWR